MRRGKKARHVIYKEDAQPAMPSPAAKLPNRSPEAHYCIKCGQLACFSSDHGETWLCGGHWGMTAYGVKLQLSRLITATTGEKDDEHDDTQRPPESYYGNWYDGFQS